MVTSRVAWLFQNRPWNGPHNFFVLTHARHWERTTLMPSKPLRLLTAPIRLCARVWNFFVCVWLKARECTLYARIPNWFLRLVSFISLYTCLHTGGAVAESFQCSPLELKVQDSLYPRIFKNSLLLPSREWVLGSLQSLELKKVKVGSTGT